MTRIFSTLRFLPTTRRGATPVAAPRRPRLSFARASLSWGLIAFSLATAGLVAMVETAKPEWRDPEYGTRLQQLRRWKNEAPDRPLVVFFGSSRTQMGIAPAAMGFPDEPGSPLVYNFGYRAAHPFRACFQFTRLIDDGIKPDFVVLQLASNELTAADRSQFIREDWAGRLSVRELERLKSSRQDVLPLLKPWLKARTNAWSESGNLIVSDQLPDWHSERVRENYYWKDMDQYGFAPHHIKVLSGKQREELYARTRQQHAPTFAGRSVNETAQVAIRELVAQCRAKGIAVAFYWAPESSSYRSWYSDAARATETKYKESLISELAVTVFPSPEGVADTDFIDGFHLMEHGARSYSRWLADTHLRQWLARHHR